MGEGRRPGEHPSWSNSSSLLLTALNAVIGYSYRQPQQTRVRVGRSNNEDGRLLRKGRQKTTYRRYYTVHLCLWDVPSDDPESAPAEEAHDADPVSTKASSLRQIVDAILSLIMSLNLNSTTHYDMRTQQMAMEMTVKFDRIHTSASSNVTSPSGTSGAAPATLCSKDEAHQSTCSSFPEAAGQRWLTLNSRTMGPWDHGIAPVARSTITNVEKTYNQTGTSPVRANKYKY